MLTPEQKAINAAKTAATQLRVQEGLAAKKAAPIPYSPMASPVMKPGGNVVIQGATAPKPGYTGATAGGGVSVNMPVGSVTPAPIYRAPAQGPTPGNAVTVVGGTPPAPAPVVPDFNSLSDEEKGRSLFVKEAKLAGSSLTDDELGYKYSATMKANTVDDPYAGVSGVLARQQKEAKTEYEQEQARLKAQREGLMAQKGAALDTTLQRDVSRTQAAGKREGEAVQAALSFSGFGRSTYNADKQALIQQDVSDRELMLTQQKNLDLETYRRELEGEDERNLAPLRAQARELQQKAAQLEVDSAIKVAELNQKNKVNGAEAIENILKSIGTTTKKGFDKDLTDSIKDGYIYKLGGDGLPVRIKGADGVEIKTGVDDSKSSDIEWTAPKVDMFGNTIPGYLFNKKTLQLTTIDPKTGSQTVLDTPNPQQAIANFKNFDEYTKSIGTGTVVKGSPYHKGFEVDIDGKINDPIAAFTGGKVVAVDINGTGSFGKNVTIEDSAGNKVRYAHMNGVTVNKGDVVAPGQFIGPMGNTGTVIVTGKGDGSHLHIEARDKSGKLIPLSSLVSNNMYNYNTSNQRQQWTGSPEQVNEMYAKGWGDNANDVAAYKRIISEGGVPINRTAAKVAAETSKQAAESARKRAEDLAKPLSGDAAKVNSITKTGLSNLNELRGIITKEVKKSTDATKFLTNRDLVDLIDTLADKVGRIRSGGAINKDEEARFKRSFFNPTDFIFSSNIQQTLLNKINRVEEEFKSVQAGLKGESQNLPSLDSFVTP